MSFGYQVLGFGSGGSAAPALSVSVIGGGGVGGLTNSPGAGNTYGGTGGGGCGGYRLLDAQLVEIGTTYQIVVGAGQTDRNQQAGSVQTSSFIGGSYSVTSQGGGYGGNNGGSGGADANSPNGGGGGGSGGWNGQPNNVNYNATIAGRSGVLGQDSGGAYRNGGGGGGGMGTAGANAKNFASGGSGTVNTDNGGGNGGAGITDTVSGASVCGGGGGGGGFSGDSAGTASHGAGAGGSGANGANGTANTGGGAGGGGGAANTASSGGSGVVYVRSALTASATTGSPTTSTYNGENLYKFTGSGSITF